MRGLKKTLIAGVVFTSFGAASCSWANRSTESPPPPRPPRPSVGGDWSNVIEPVTPTEKEFQLLPENGNAKPASVARLFGQRRAELRVPLLRKIFDSIAHAVRCEAEGAVGEVEEVRLPEHAFVQRHDDQVSLGGDRADRSPRFLAKLCASDRWREHGRGENSERS